MVVRRTTYKAPEKFKGYNSTDFFLLTYNKYGLVQGYIRVYRVMYLL